jgi:hypothetical protein
MSVKVGTMYSIMSVRKSRFFPPVKQVPVVKKGCELCLRDLSMREMRPLFFLDAHLFFAFSRIPEHYYWCRIRNRKARNSGDGSHFWAIC